MTTVETLSLAGDFAPDLRHLPDCHFFVAFVFEAQGRPSPGIVTDYALKSYKRAVGAFQ